MIKISKIILLALTVVFLPMPSYADPMNEQAALYATIRPSVTPAEEPCTAVRIYLNNGNWIALDITGKTRDKLKHGQVKIMFDADDDASSNPKASYCLRPPEVEGKEVGPDCAPISGTLTLTKAEGKNFKGILSWDSLEFTLAPYITFEAEYEE